MKALLDQIRTLAGPQRCDTFVAAAEFILLHKIADPVETGCYRGCGADGESTVILARLAQVNLGKLRSIELDAQHIAEAKKHIRERGLTDFVEFIPGDSVVELSKLAPGLRFVYLDSFDHDEANPGPCQRHELAEIGAIYGKMQRPCGILLDDNVIKTGGKPLLGSAFLRDRGWKLAATGYQLFFTLE